MIRLVLLVCPQNYDKQEELFNLPSKSFPMSDQKTLLDFANNLVKGYTGSVLSEAQRLILMEALNASTKMKTYGQVAAAIGYSGGYIKLMAAQLWKLLSKVIGRKVTKANVRTILQWQLKCESLEYPSPQFESLGKETPISKPDRQQVTPEVILPVATTHEDKEMKDDRSRMVSILVVDDQPHNVALLTDILEQDEYEVWQATSGVEALEMARKILPDLILLDINMPDMDGYTVCQHLKEDRETTGIPIIFISALDGSWDRVKGFSVGGSDYISKPFNTLEAIVRIENKLQIRQIQEKMLGLKEQSQATPDPTIASESKQILMVDDELKNLALLTDLLEEEGYEVWQADSGSEALRIAEMILPDLILLDIKMPDINGYNVCQKLKADAKTKLIPVIFVSAMDEAWDKVKAFSVGGSDYVAKPIEILELMARIRYQLQIWGYSK
ncbi:MAG: response regulator [Trichodesmium sp. MO_231.B1]|nr:response regulator [Trichodesmium sp. MO_231.B1]